ncbi:MAG: hypothetical protein J6U53_04245, partial [Tidjanibacter sp.]|nr:hypothetical protein [Tidjanibacter sp.]
DVPQTAELLLYLAQKSLHSMKFSGGKLRTPLSRMPCIHLVLCVFLVDVPQTAELLLYLAQKSLHSMKFSGGANCGLRFLVCLAFISFSAFSRQPTTVK